MGCHNSGAACSLESRSPGESFAKHSAVPSAVTRFDTSVLSYANPLHDIALPTLLFVCRPSFAPLRSCLRLFALHLHYLVVRCCAYWSRKTSSPSESHAARSIRRTEGLQRESRHFH